MADTNENPHLQKIKNNAVYPGNLKISDSRPVKTPFATNSGKRYNHHHNHQVDLLHVVLQKRKRF